MKQHPNSIYYTLRTLTNGDSRKSAISYIYSILNSRNSMNLSKNVLIDEGAIVYKQLDNIGRVTLDNFEEDFIDDIKATLKNKDYEPRKKGVEEIIFRILNKYGVEDTFQKVGYSLKKLLDQKPNLQNPLKKIRAGNIQRYEQQAIKKELLQYLK